MPVPILRTAKGRHAAPLPDPFPTLATSRFNVRFRPGQVVMLAGPPGAGKTNLALVAALRMAAKGATCLYISADSDETTMAARAAAAITGHPVVEVERTIEFGLFAEEYGPRLALLPIRFEYDPSDPSIEDIGHAIAAWVELWGRPPDLLVVDNLMNLSGDDGNEWQAMRQSIKNLHWLARRIKSCVLLLHHTSEQESQHIESAPPRGAIQGKVSQLQSLILTTASRGGELFLAVVKNRHGLSDPMAREPLRWVVDFSNCRVFDQRLSEELASHGNTTKGVYAPQVEH